jgi:hypothetical protein
MKTSFWIALNISLLVLLVSVCLVIGDVGQVTVDSIRTEKLSIRPENTEVYKQWIQPDQNTNVNIYLWHVTNAQEVLKGQRPIMTEIGPFCYEKVSKKADIRHGANRQIKYHNSEFFIEVNDPTRTCMNLDTSITSFNVPFPLVMRTLESMSQVYQDLFLTMIPPQWGILVTKTARELLWGYEDPVLKILEPFLSGLSTYGHLIGRNNTQSAEYLIEDGSKDQDPGKIQSWNGINSLEDIWRGVTELNGVDFTSLAPIHHEATDGKLTVFFDHLCRSVEFEKTSDVEYVGPIQATFYDLGVDFLQANDPYCRDSKFVGTLDLSKCTSFHTKSKLSLPLVMSKPHFLDGERSLWKSVEGLSPSEKYHNSHLLVDQNTGVILKSEINFQTNIELNRWALKQANISAKENFIAPIYWTQMTNEASAKYLNFVAGEPFSHFEIIRKWPTALLIFGVVINLIAWTIYCQFKKQSNLITEFRGNFGKGLLERFDTSIVSRFSNGKVEDLSISKLCETSKLETTNAKDQQPTESGDGQTTNEKPEV